MTLDEARAVIQARNILFKTMQRSEDLGDWTRARELRIELASLPLQQARDVVSDAYRGEGGAALDLVPVLTTRGQTRRAPSLSDYDGGR